MRQRPDDTQPPVNPSVVYKRIGQNDNRRELFKAIRIEPDSANAAAAYNLCVIVAKGRFEEATRLCRSAVASVAWRVQLRSGSCVLLGSKRGLPAAAVLPSRVNAGIPCAECDRLLAQNSSEPASISSLNFPQMIPVQFRVLNDVTSRGSNTIPRGTQLRLSRV